jgi:hypothetical protein
VPLETLDAVVARLGLPRVDVVKIDVEGAEANVIAGMRNVLTLLRPMLMMEVNDGALRAQGSSEAALLETLRGQFGYRGLVFSVTSGLAEPLVEGARLSSNIIAVPGKRVGEVLI